MTRGERGWQSAKSRYYFPLSCRACESSESDEDHGLALAVRQLLWANTCQDLNNIHVTLFKEFLATLTDLSIKVFLKSTKDDEVRTDYKITATQLKKTYV